MQLYIGIGLDSGLVLKGWKAIILTGVTMIQWYISASIIFLYISRCIKRSQFEQA